MPLHWPLVFPVVAARGGFDLMIGNPPFLGGTRISGPAGADVRGFIARYLAGRATSRADLVSFFFLRAAALARSIGFLATNSIAQGDTRETGLDRLLADGWRVHRAVKSTPWPGAATLEIAKVWLTADPWAGPVTLDDRRVEAIASTLDPAGRVAGRPVRLDENRGGAFEGSKAYGMGFTMSPDQAARMLAADPACAEVLHPFLNGDDVVTRPDHSASRWAIDFRTRTEAQARAYPACWRHVETHVKPERLAKDATRYPRLVGQWWQHWNPRPGLYAAIAGLDRVLVLAITSRVVQPVFVPARQVLSHALVVFPFADDHTFGVLSSGFHREWALANASTLEDRIRYTATDCFATFPRPDADDAITAAGRALDAHRSALMLGTGRGLTRTYNAVHDPAVTDPGTTALRDLHARLDHAVRDAYGWADLDLGHGFHDTRHGVRFTFAPAARGEVLDRLLELNHRRAACD